MKQSIKKEYTNLIKKKHSLKNELLVLPNGYISVKNINGNTQYYLQRREKDKIVSLYIKKDDLSKVESGIKRRKEICLEIQKINSRLKAIEDASKILDYNLYAQLIFAKMSFGVDELDYEEKSKCISFGYAMNGVEGVYISEEAQKELDEWKEGKRSFKSIFDDLLKRYGFPTEGKG